jgi:euchromatic histone-lysine N-methyltransferase
LQFRLEVYKTEDRGWGVRSWDSIPAGAVVATFYGKVLK